MKMSIAFIFAAIALTNCTKEYDCADQQIRPAFISFLPADIDTIILRKFKPNDNFQNLVDTVRIVNGFDFQYYTATDTTTIFINSEKYAIKAGFDWLLFIPAKNRTIKISDIVSEKKKGKCNSGIFSMDKTSCTCTNAIFSAKRDNQIVTLFNAGKDANTVYIRN